MWVAPLIRQLARTGNQQGETYRFESTVGVCYRTASIVMATHFSYLFYLKHYIEMQSHHRLGFMSLIRRTRVGGGADWETENEEGY